MNTYDIKIKENVLESLIESALLDTVIWTNRRCVCVPQEPDYVAALSTKFLKDLFDILVIAFPDYDFSVSGVFCHQKPIVDINLAKKPELGDILFIYADRKINGDKVLNSLLMQVKMSNDLFLKIHQNEKHQLELYRKWPEFRYFRAGNLNGQKRNIFPKEITEGAQYLLIASDPLIYGSCIGRSAFLMGCSMPDDILYVDNSLSKELVDMLKFKSGRTFDSDPWSTEDGWSLMIWDLLRIAASQFSRRKNAQLGSIPRKSEYNHFCTEGMSDTSLLDEVLWHYDEPVQMGDESGGVSVVLIESQLRREQEGSY